MRIQRTNSRKGLSAGNRLERLRRMMDPCVLCPRRCRTARSKGEFGFCGIGHELTVSSWGSHFGEEQVLVGRGGSGTIFLTGCNLGCLFCQNDDISILKRGRIFAVDQMVDVMLAMQKDGCSNINFVTPSPQVPNILEAIIRARDARLRIPIVYNCGGFESLDVLKLLDGYVDIYMPDIKFFDCELARDLTGRADYPDVARMAVKQMHRQVGDLEIQDGVAKRGLLVRHLVMPEGVADSKRIIDFLADDISANTYVNVMAQYRPCYRAREFPRIARPTRRDEWRQAYDHAAARGLRLAN